MRTPGRSSTSVLPALLLLPAGLLLGVWSFNVALPVWLIQALPVLVLSCALGLVTIHIVFGNGTAGLEDADELVAPRASGLSLSAAAVRTDSFQRPGQHRRHCSSRRHSVSFAQEQLEHPDLQHQPQHKAGQEQQQQQQQQQRLEPRRPWEDLPDALFAEVVARLGPEDLRNLRCVCREWLITTNHTLTRLAPSEMRLDVVVPTFPYLTTLDLGACAQDIRTHRLHALRGLPHLEHLSLGSSQRGSATAVNDRCLLEVACSLRALKSLNLAHCVHLSDEGFIPIGQLSCLTRISLASCVAIGDLGVVLLAQLPVLADLEMPMCFKVTDKGLAALGALHKTLTSLDISGCQLVSQAGVASLSQLTGLKKLSLLNLGPGRPCVNDESLRSLSTLTCLTSLALGRLQDGVDRVSEAGLAALADHHPHLAHLSLLNKDGLTDAALEAIALGLQTSLRTLHIRSCSRITQASLTALAPLTGLVELDLVNNMAMSIPASQLRELIWGSCTGTQRLQHPQPRARNMQHPHPGSAQQHSLTQLQPPQQVQQAQQQQQLQHMQPEQWQPQSSDQPQQVQQAQQQHAQSRQLDPQLTDSSQLQQVQQAQQQRQQHVQQHEQHAQSRQLQPQLTDSPQPQQVQQAQQQVQHQQQQHAQSQPLQPQHAHLSSSATSPDQSMCATLTPAHADTHSISPMAPPHADTHTVSPSAPAHADPHSNFLLTPPHADAHLDSSLAAAHADTHFDSPLAAAHADTHFDSPLAPASLSPPPLALRALSLGSVVGLSPLAQPCDEVLATLTPLGPTLQSLVLVSYTGSLTSRPAAAVLAALSRLTLLELQGATGLGNAGLAALAGASCMPHLRSLSLIRAGSSSSSSSVNTGGGGGGGDGGGGGSGGDGGQAAASSTAAAPASTSAPQPGGELGVEGGGSLGGGSASSGSWDGATGGFATERGITEAGMLALVGALGPSSLTSLNLSHCPGMGDGLLVAVAAQLQALTSLSLVQASGATDAGVSALSSLTRLRTLDLSYCEQVTGSGFGTWVSCAPPPLSPSPLVGIHSRRQAPAAPGAAATAIATAAAPATTAAGLCGGSSPPPAAAVVGPISSGMHAAEHSGATNSGAGTSAAHSAAAHSGAGSSAAHSAAAHSGAGTSAAHSAAAYSSTGTSAAISSSNGDGGGGGNGDDGGGVSGPSQGSFSGIKGASEGSSRGSGKGRSKPQWLDWSSGSSKARGSSSPFSTSGMWLPSQSGGGTLALSAEGTPVQQQQQQQQQQQPDNAQVLPQQQQQYQLPSHAWVLPPPQQQQLPGHERVLVVLPLRQRLLSLHLSCCSALDDGGLAQVGQHLTALTRLDLSQCPCITDYGTKHLTRLTRLSGLDLAHCSRLANHTLAVASRLPLLTSLKLPGCVRISDAGLAHLPALRSVLLTLHLDKCIKVSDAGLAKVAQLTSLTSLRLARCPDITDEGVAALAHCTRLSALSLAHCSGVSEASLFALSGLTGLASLEF